MVLNCCSIDWNLVTAIAACIISTVACIVSYITSKDTKKMMQLAIKESQLNNEIKVQITNCRFSFGVSCTHGSYVILSLQIYNRQRTLYQPTVKMIIRKGKTSFPFLFIPTETFAEQDYLKDYPSDFYRGMILNVSYNFMDYTASPFFERFENLISGEYQIEYKVYSQNIEIDSITIKHDDKLHFSFDAQEFEVLKPWERTFENSLKQIRMATEDFKQNVLSYIETFQNKPRQPQTK